MSRILRHALLFSLAFAAGCGSQSVSHFVQHVDEQSGESYTHAVEPVRLAAERPALSRVGKDYLYVAPVSVSGIDTPRNYLWFAVGSSTDRRLTGALLPSVNRIVLVIDGMPMTFDIVPWADVASSEPFDIGVEHYSSYSARVTRSQLGKIAAAKEISAFVTNGEDRSPTYALVAGAHDAWAGL